MSEYSELNTGFIIKVKRAKINYVGTEAEQTDKERRKSLRDEYMAEKRRKTALDYYYTKKKKQKINTES